jgi:hypothetical protein
MSRMLCLCLQICSSCSQEEGSEGQADGHGRHKGSFDPHMFEKKMVKEMFDALVSLY